MQVKDIMTGAPEESVKDCCKTMEGHQVRQVPVVDELGSCCGMVAQADVGPPSLDPGRRRSCQASLATDRRTITIRMLLKRRSADRDSRLRRSRDGRHGTALRCSRSSF